jgi:hypothetical protein
MKTVDAEVWREPWEQTAVYMARVRISADTWMQAEAGTHGPVIDALWPMRLNPAWLEIWEQVRQDHK